MPVAMDDLDGPGRLSVGDDQFVSQRAELLSLAESRLRSRADAEDVVQEVWFRWCQHQHEVDVSSAWLRAVTRNLVVDRLRAPASRREVLVDDQSCFPESASADVPVDHRALSEGMSMVMGALTQLERAVFVLRECFEWRHSHVARLLGRTEQAVRQVSRRARQHVAASSRRVTVSDREVAVAAGAYAAAHTTGDVMPLLRALAPDVMADRSSRSGSWHDVVGALLVRGDRLLLGRRRGTLPWHSDVWDLPGSHVGPTEGLVSCMLRAARDELGIAPQDPRHVASFSGADFELNVFSASVWEGRIRNAEPRQHDALAFVSRDEASRLPLADPRLLDLFEHADRG